MSESGTHLGRRQLIKTSAITGAGAALLGGVGLGAAAPAQAAVAGMTPITTFPNEDFARVSHHLGLARELAGDDLYPYFAQRGVSDQIYPELDDLAQTPGLVTPIRAFDDLLFVGHVGVSAWALDTSDGLVLFDALNDPDEAEKILVAGVVALGYQPSDISHVVVTHEHRDHFGGARYLQQTYGSRVVASEPAWATMATNTSAPVRDITVGDGEVFRVGAKAITFLVTPGHTTGSLSSVIPVRDGRTEHVAALYGGFGIPRTVDAKMQQIASLRKFAEPTWRSGVDVIIGNHQVQDQSLVKFDLVRHRRLNGQRALDPHPFVLGSRNAYSRFLALQEQCVRVNAARNGQVLPDQSAQADQDSVWKGYKGV